MRLEIVNDFSDEEFAAIGKLVWSFTVVEHELARAAMWLRHETASTANGSDIDDQLRKIMKADLKGRFECFITALRATGPDSGILAWIAEVTAWFSGASEVRNRVCHGNWRRLSSGLIAVRFFDRKSLVQEVELDYSPVTLAELAELSDSNLGWAKSISLVAGTATM